MESQIRILPTLYKGKYIYYAEGGGDEDVKGGTEIFPGIKEGALKVLDIQKGGYKLFKVLVQQGPGVSTPTNITTFTIYFVFNV